MEKIKAVLVGHSSHDNDHPSGTKTSDTTSSSPSNTKATEGHTNLSKLGQEHHDPEVEAKEATSAAGNYPYWGNLPSEGGDSHSHETALGGTHGGDSHTHQKDAGLATGAGLAGGAAASGVTGQGQRESAYEHRALPSQQGTSSAAELPDRTRNEALQTSTAQDPSATHSVQDASHKGELAAAATGVGAAGAGAVYLGTHRRDENEDHDKLTRAAGAASGPTSKGPGTLDPGYASQTSASAAAPQPYTNINETSYAPGSDNPNPTSHKKEEGALAAGLGAAGLGGAGYAAHKRAEDHSSTDNRPTTSHGIQQRDTTTTAGGGIHNTVVGAGSGEDAHAHQRTHKQAFNPGSLGSSHTSTSESKVDPREQASIAGALGESTHRDVDNRHGLATAGVIGTGADAAAVAAEEKHRRHEDDKTKKDGHSFFGSSHKDDDKPKKEGHSLFGSSHKDDNKPHHEKHTQSQPPATSQPAQLAAQQAWNKQNQGSSTTTSHHPTTDAEGQATSAAGNNHPHRSGEDRSAAATGGTTTDRSSHSSAAIGPAAGVGLAGAGATAAYYGQGKEHDQNPRSEQAQKVAERALGEDGAARGPSSGTQGREFPLTTGDKQGREGAGVDASGLSSGSGQDSSKVVHKCHECGANNDISEYFKKDAAFRMGS